MSRGLQAFARSAAGSGTYRYCGVSKDGGRQEYVSGKDGEVHEWGWWV